MATAKKKKRKSQAPVALVYFVTVIIFIALLAVLAIYLLKQFNIIGQKKDGEEAVTTPVFTDLFARVNSKGILSDMAVIRISPEEQTILVIPISAVTKSAKEPDKTMRDIFAETGMPGVKSAVQDTFDIALDNYATLTNDAFERVADVFGGITYTAPEELYYLSQDNDENDISIVKGDLVNLNGRQIRLLTQYPVFSNGRQGNNDFLGLALENLLNNAFQQANITLDNLDNIYNIITSNSDTDITTDNYKLMKSYLKQMLSAGLTPATSMCPQGTWSEDGNTFEVSADFKMQLSELVSKDEAEAAAADSAALTAPAAPAITQEAPITEAPAETQAAE